jgi:Flp pilus assembly protein TadD
MTDRRWTFWIAVLLAVVSIVAFAPALWNDFVDWDDSVNFTTNKSFRGLAPKNIKWMFSTLLMGHWIPVTWFTLGLDYVIWGMNPVGYHLTSLLVHAANVAALYLLALMLLRRATVWPAATRQLAAMTGALFYGLHPLRVESVAWVTERRDVLSTLFFLLTLLAYVRASDEPERRRWWHGWALGAFVFGIASKSMVMTLPAILVLLDVYPLRRVALGRGVWTAHRAVWMEKVPYAVLGAAAAGIGFYAQHTNQFFSSMERYSWVARLAISAYSTCFYLWKTLFPGLLGPVYEAPYRINLLDPYFVTASVAVVLITVIGLVLRRSYPAILAAWVSYVVLLSPVVGIAHSGFQIAHDRYSYLPLLGPSLLVGAGAGFLATRITGLRVLFQRVAIGAMAVWLLTLGFLSWHQSQVWRDTEALWTFAVDVEPRCAVCHSNLGAFLVNRNQPGLAIEHLLFAISLRPDNPRTHVNLGVALLRIEAYSTALARLEAASAAHPKNRELLTALGLTYVRSGLFGDALVPLSRALKLYPNSPDAAAVLGVALAHLGEKEESLKVLRRAVELDGDSPHARYGYGWALAHFGDIPAARAHQAYLHLLDPKLAMGLNREISSMN